MPNKNFTYRQIPINAISTNWLVNDKTFITMNDEPKLLQGWQKNDNIKVSAEFSFKNSSLSEYVRKDFDAQFILSYNSLSDYGGTSIQHVITKQTVNFNTDKIQTLLLEGIVDGKQIAGMLKLTLSLCLGHKNIKDYKITNDDLLLASEVGSILYQQEKFIILEGQQTYFPISVIDFKQKGYDPGAFYFLKQIHTSLDADFFTAYRLYFNSSHPQFHFLNDSKESQTKEYLIDMIFYDIYKQLIMNALNDKEFTISQDIDPKSHIVRDVYSRLLENIRNNYYSSESYESMREKALSTDSTTSNKFLCVLQSDLLKFGEK